MSLAALALLLVLGPPEQRTPSVELELSPCLVLEPIALVSQVTLEFEGEVDVALRPANATSTSSERNGATTLAIACSETGVSLELDDPLTAKTMRRELALAPDDPALARTLALAVVEFVRASWLELELEPAPELAQVVPRPALDVEPPPSPALLERARRVARHEPEAWTLGVGPRVMVLTTRGLVHAGAAARVVHRPRPHFAWTLAGAFVHGRHPLALGRVDTHAFALAPALLAGSFRESLAVMAGLGGSLGGVHVIGHPNADASLAGARFTRMQAGVFALARASAQLPHALVLSVELELGVITLPVRARAGEATVLSFAGPWIAVGLELAFGWP